MRPRVRKVEDDIDAWHAASAIVRLLGGVDSIPSSDLKLILAHARQIAAWASLQLRNDVPQ